MNRLQWQKIDMQNRKWLSNDWEWASGLRHTNDPLGFIHRAIVYRTVDGVWGAWLWGRGEGPRVHRWLKMGNFDSKRAAMQAARGMAVLTASNFEQ